MTGRENGLRVSQPATHSQLELIWGDRRNFRNTDFLVSDVNQTCSCSSVFLTNFDHMLGSGLLCGGAYIVRGTPGAGIPVLDKSLSWSGSKPSGMKRNCWFSIVSSCSRKPHSPSMSFAGSPMNHLSSTLDPERTVWKISSSRRADWSVDC